LLKRNPDNRQYYFGLEEARGLTSEDQKLQLYADLRESFPRAMLARRIPLSYASGEKFRSLVDQYLRHALHKGAPPLFVDLRSLYTQPGKAAIIEELLLGYIASLIKCERFDEKGFSIFKFFTSLLCLMLLFSPIRCERLSSRTGFSYFMDLLLSSSALRLS
jgi:peptide alpha-N-acetyltransferase